MSRKKQHLRIAAMFCLISFLQSLILPSVALALTSGPTSPETTSFEPVDATDMVNLATGNFTYNIPLLEVPGPEGGYPLSLAYHGGIKPLSDASWAGLGWSLSPGAINRIVNGWPDDHKNIERTVTDYWSGGSTTSFSVGVGVGIPNTGVSVGLDLSISHDTYRGFGGDVGLSVSLGPGKYLKGIGNTGGRGLGLSFGVSAGSSGFGANAGLGYTTKSGQTLGLRGSVHTAGSPSLGVSASMSRVTVGANLSSRGLKPSLSVAGISMNAVNNKMGKISTSSFGFGIPIPVAPLVWINIGFNYRRYWMLEKDQVETYGTLYAKDSYTWSEPYNNSINSRGPTDESMDSYALLEPGLTGTTGNPDKQLGGSFPNYDAYQVSGQGVSGSMQPYIFENASLFRQRVDKVDSDGDVEGIVTNFGIDKKITRTPNFRFVNDFSNMTDMGNLTSSNFSFSNNSNLFSASTYTTPTAQSNTPSGEGYPTGFYNTTSESHLAGSKHIETYTNKEIANAIQYGQSVSGLKQYKNLSASERRNFVVGNDNIEDQVGAYTVTNESGVTYHYTLPVYTYDEFIESYRPNTGQGVSRNSQDNPHPYAYTWLLTAITGPDYVDRGGGSTGDSADGIVDDNDWGYWVNFSYGKWTDTYQWRTPGIGKHNDIYNKVEHYSSGKKQIYYLDAIKTRSHTALFVKEIRNDGKGVSSLTSGGFGTGTQANTTKYCSVICDPPNGSPYNSGSSCLQKFSAKGTVTSVMKLNEILLFKNSDFNGNDSGLNTLRSDGPETYSQTLSHTYTKGATCGHSICQGDIPSTSCSAPSPWQKKYHYEEKVIDAADMSANTTLVNKAIRRIQLNTDYSLAPNTANSFSNSTVYQNSPSIPSTKTGKLTLNSVTFKGENNTTVMPPVNFYYDDPNPPTRNWEIASFGLRIFGNPGLFENTIVKFSSGGTDYYLRVKDRFTASIGNEVYFYEVIGANSPSVGLSGSGLHKTKNPPASNSKFDYWGYYKLDFEGASSESTTSKERKPTTESSKQIDVWSLREVETSLGARIKVDYGHKEISNNVLKYDKDVYNIQSIDGPGYTSPMAYGGSFTADIGFFGSVNLNDAFSVNQTVGIMYPATYSMDSNFSGTTNDNIWTVEKRSGTITAINSNTITVNVNFDSYPEYICSNSASLPVLGQPVYTYIGEFGYIETTNNGEMSIGDGLQVNAITVEQSSGDERTTHYDYAGGTTTYEPIGFKEQTPSYSTNNYGGPCQYTWYSNNYLNNLFEDLFSIAREVPGPSTMYEYAEVSESVNGNAVPGKRKYHFQVFESNMVKYVTNGGYNFPSGMKTKVVTLHNKTSQIGNLLSMETYNGEDHLMTKSTHNFVDPNHSVSSTEYENDYDNQGVIEQAFNEIRFTYGGTFSTLGWSVMSKRIDYPSILKSTVEYSEGVELTTYNRKYDFYSGEPIEIETEDGYGLHYLTRTIPAYRKYAQMGPRSNTWDNKNMLLQNTGTYAYRSNGNGVTIGNPISASVTTWNRDWKYRQLDGNDYVDFNSVDYRKVWRAHKSYVFKDEINPDGTLKNWSNNTTDFNWSPSATLAAQWLKTGEVTRYDRHSKAIEERNVDGTYSGVKMGYDETLPIVTASPAKYVEFAYSGAEDHIGSPNYFGGEVRGPSPSSVDNTKAHTGDNSIRLNSGTRYGFNYKVPVRTYNSSALPGDAERKKYEARVWIHESNISTSFNYLYCHYKDHNDQTLLWEGAKISDPTTIKAGEWYLLRLPIEVDNSSALLFCKKIEIGTWVPSSAGNTYLDDFRFAPVDAAITSYVYDKKTDRVTYMLDQEHLFTEYEYDPAGRLVRVYRETTENPTGKRLVSENEYHYKRPY